MHDTNQHFILKGEKKGSCSAATKSLINQQQHAEIKSIRSESTIRISQHRIPTPAVCSITVRVEFIYNMPFPAHYACFSLP